ncbi:MAG: TnpV protein [Lachnospiraceae bacterium]|nr:TnpV protein [Lachnospiraceae bacterium]
MKAKQNQNNQPQRPEEPGKGAAMMNLRYEQNGDYQIPALQMDRQPEGILTKYGLMRQKFLKEHRSGLYTGLLLRGRLKEHLLAVQEQAEQRMDLLAGQMQEAQGVTEQLKEEDSVQWIRKMNSIQHSAEETVLSELIYS